MVCDVLCFIAYVKRYQHKTPKSMIPSINACRTYMVPARAPSSSLKELLLKRYNSAYLFPRLSTNPKSLLSCMPSSASKLGWSATPAGPSRQLGEASCSALRDAIRPTFLPPSVPVVVDIPAAGRAAFSSWTSGCACLASYATLAAVLPRRPRSVAPSRCSSKAPFSRLRSRTCCLAAAVMAAECWP